MYSHLSVLLIILPLFLQIYLKFTTKFVKGWIGNPTSQDVKSYRVRKVCMQSSLLSLYVIIKKGQSLQNLRSLENACYSFSVTVCSVFFVTVIWRHPHPAKRYICVIATLLCDPLVVNYKEQHKTTKAQIMTKILYTDKDVINSFALYMYYRWKVLIYLIKTNVHLDFFIAN